MPVQVGELAPDFEMETHTGQRISLADYRGRHVVVLYFYPKDESAGCTKQACAFRDAYEDFTDAGAVVIGVSSDSTDSHARFAGRHQLPFLLLTDRNGTLRQSYGVPRTFGVLPGRVTYVIDREGVVRHVFNSQFSTKRHVSEALQVVRGLAES